MDTAPIQQLKNQLADAEIFPEIQQYLNIVSEHEFFNAGHAKRIIRDTQNELPSAWKFYMGLGSDKQALVLLDGFTTLPLSLARNCGHVVVYGLEAAEVDLLQKLALSKKISNYSSVDELANLATQFDLIVICSSPRGGHARRELMHDIEKFIHEQTEVWVLAANEKSVGFAKSTLQALTKHGRMQGASPAARSKDYPRLLFADRPLATSRSGKEFIKKIDLHPFAIVGMSPSVLRMKTAKPLRDDREMNLNGAAMSAWQGMGAAEIAIGAARHASSPSFLHRLLLSLPGIDHNGYKIQNYRVSPSGKVLLFARLQRGTEVLDSVLKLPLNSYSQRRLGFNQRLLEYLAGSAKIGEGRKDYFPAPLFEGSFERQAYFAETILAGETGSALRLAKKDRERLIHEIFSFWVSLQQSLAHDYYFDEETFEQQIEMPFRQSVAIGRRGRPCEMDVEPVIDFLKEAFLHKRFLLSLIHGDLSFKNIILQPHFLTLRGIIDWDLARETAFPLLDVFHFFVRSQRISYRKSPILILHQLINGELVDAEFQEILAMYQEVFEVDRQTLLALMILYWVQRFSAHLGTLKIFDDRFMRRNFDEPLLLIENLIAQASTA